jgi:hypothetical protein
MLGSGIIDWIYQLVLAIVAYITSWFGFGTMKSTEEEVVEVKPPMGMPPLMPEMAAFPSSDIGENLP